MSLRQTWGMTRETCSERATSPRLFFTFPPPSTGGTFQLPTARRPLSSHVPRPRPQVSPEALRRRRRAVARVGDAQGRDRERASRPWLPAVRPAGRGEDDACPRARDGAQLRATTDGGQTARRARVG